ncbi:MAG: hypothetical protein ACUVRJ_10400 [Candidatus Villigracilaceae bacterium]
MKPWRILLVGLVFALALSLAVPAHALDGDDPPPPLSGWLQWLLQWVGLATPTPTRGSTSAFTPTPAVTEYRIESLEELERLPALLQPRKRVRAYATSADINAIIAVYLSSPKAQANGLRQGKVTLLDGALKVEGTVSRSVIEEHGIPSFQAGNLIQVAGEGSLAAVDCRLVVSLKTVQMNGISFPMVSLLEQMLNQALGKEWPSQICLERVTITSQQIVAEGYRR